MTRYGTVRYCTVLIQRCHPRCLASLQASSVLVCCCLQFAVVAVIVAWGGLTVCCDAYWFFHGWRHLRKWCWSLYVDYELLHTGVHLLWLWELWFVICAWWLCWTCWRHSIVLFRCSGLIAVLLMGNLFSIDRGYFFPPVSQSTYFVFKSTGFIFLAKCSLQFNLKSKCTRSSVHWFTVVWRPELEANLTPPGSVEVKHACYSFVSINLQVTLFQ